MISLAALLAIYPALPRVVTMNDLNIAISRKSDDWRWEDVTAEEIQTDLADLIARHAELSRQRVWHVARCRG